MRLNIKKVIVNRYGKRVVRYKPYYGRERIGNYMGYKYRKDAIDVGRYVIYKEAAHSGKYVIQPNKRKLLRRKRPGRSFSLKHLDPVRIRL